MHQYGVREVEKLLRLPRSTIRAFVDAGFVAPARGPRNALLFSFQDLIVLRTAQTLAAAKVPQRRITRSVKELRKHLPESMPLSGLSICAVADHVVVREGGTRWQADSGQYLLGFEVDPSSGSLCVIDPKPKPSAPEAVDAADPNDLFEHALALEEDDANAAIALYEQTIAANPEHLDARVNLGLLLQQAGRAVEAERVYRAALATCGNDPTCLYNLGILLEDLERKPEAAAAYETALESDPTMADCHYNLGLLYEQLERPREAIRHMAQYRRLMEKQSR
jgi:DNA-binding transcriptional MerR regulator